MTDKELIAVGGKVTYRRVEIKETAKGCTFCWNGRQFDCEHLGEATAAIDAIYSSLSNVIVIVEPGTVHVQ